jgi:hypothetical protein
MLASAKLTRASQMMAQQTELRMLMLKPGFGHNQADNVSTPFTMSGLHNQPDNANTPFPMSGLQTLQQNGLSTFTS